MDEINLKEIQEQVNKVILYSQEVYDNVELNTDELIEKWYANKKKFIDLFGGKLIYEIPSSVVFDLGEEVRLSRITDFCDWIEGRYGCSVLCDFIYDVRKSFFSNIVDKDRDYVRFDNKIIHITKGMKIIRAFKFFVDDKETLTDIQNKASMVIQENAVCGKLCLSVHPLDFLSSSENNYNWRSCHSLDGDYRVGNLSYMGDDCSIICYLKGDEEVSLPNFPESVPWNNKKWRMLLCINKENNIFFAGRQYPFKSIGALNIIRDIIKMLIPSKNGKYTEWTNTKIEDFDGTMLSYDYIRIMNELQPLDKIVIDEPVSIGKKYHYNDLLKSTCYSPYYMCRFSSLYETTSNAASPLHVGSDVKCVRCGKKAAYSPDVMFCRDCAINFTSIINDNIIECSYCGVRMTSDDAWNIEDGTLVCSYCYHNATINCEKCGYTILADDAMETADGRQLCWNCYISERNRNNNG